MNLKQFVKKGGNALKEKYGHEHFVKIGQKSAKVNREKYGDEYFKNLSQMGVEARKKKAAEKLNAKQKEEREKVNW